MAGLTFTQPVIYPNELRRILNKPGGPVGVKVRAIALDIARIGKRISVAELGVDPRDRPRSGNYSNRFTVEVEIVGSGFQFVVRNTAKYAAVLEKGAKPHLIRARRVQYLKFKSRDGSWRVTRVVRHPGSIGRHVLWRASREAANNAGIISAYGLG